MYVSLWVNKHNLSGGGNSSDLTSDQKLLCKDEDCSYISRLEPKKATRIRTNSFCDKTKKSTNGRASGHHRVRRDHRESAVRISNMAATTTQLPDYSAYRIL